ncbi:MAG: hypothetical protein AB1486_34635 [Planctomycetota bacterium]
MSCAVRLRRLVCSPVLPVLAVVLGGCVLGACATGVSRQAQQRREFGERSGKMAATVANLGTSFTDHCSLRLGRLGRSFSAAGSAIGHRACRTAEWVTDKVPSQVAQRSRKFGRVVSRGWDGFWERAATDSRLFFERAWEELKTLE